MVKSLLRAAVPGRVWARLVWARVLAERELASARTLGWANYARVRFPDARRQRACSLRRMRLRGYAHPIFYRQGTSDRHVIRQVFGRRDYACALAQSGVRFVVDCGANIGCSTFFFLSHFPDARAVVVEPDAANMAVCRKNLAPWADRVTFVGSGVWSASVPLVVERGAFRDGAEWAIQVRAARANETPDLTALTVPDVLARGDFPHADVLKIDIEAAEKEVFDARAAEWLARVGMLVIELHGPECERAVLDALKGFEYDFARAGELSVFTFKHPRAEGPA
ncbi:MAG: FkbM family methyltransferase [Gemmataceae bacterium]|nr:FkbM family methyltransferase [Gemmataceae bacterium]